MIEEMLSLFYTSRQQVNEGRDITNVYEGRGRVYGAYLTLLYGVVLDLRGATFDIMSRDVLDDVSAVALKSRMEALQENFTGLWLKMGSSKAGYKQPVLVYDSPTWWYAISNDGSFLRIHLTLRDRNEPLDNETDTSENYLDYLEGCPPESLYTNPMNLTMIHNPSKTSQTLSFIVPVVSALSIIPAALAWTHSNHQVGTAADADFYSLISNVAMQLLGLLAMMISVISNRHLANETWFWTWILASFSAGCAGIAIPLYLIVPTEWSAAISFAGAVAQVFVTLQLLYGI